MLATRMVRFSDLVDRFLYRPDEEVGAALAFAPEIERAVVSAATESLDDYFAFEVAGERCAVPMARLREVLKVGPVTELPRAAPPVLGLLAVRGEMLPLYDPKHALGLGGTAPVLWGAGDVARAARILLVRDPDGDAGLLVDRVVGTLRLCRERIEPPPARWAERRAVAGVAHGEGARTLLLDVAEVLV